MDNKILSLDTSTSSTGWAYFENGKYVKSGIIDLKKNKNTNVRLKQMIAEIYGCIDYYSPTAIVIETPVVVRNPQVQRILTMIFGAVYGKCVVDNIEWQELRPTQWRKYVKSENEKLPRKREELKVWSVDKVKDVFGVDVSDDESDAILIGQAYYNGLKGEN